MRTDRCSELLLARAFPVAEPVDDHAARDGVKFQRIHVVIIEDILAQLGVVGAQHPLGGAGVDIALAVMTGVEQQRRALRSTQTLRKPRNNVQFDWQWPLMRNSSPLVLARSISGWKSWYQPPLPNLSDVAAKDVDEIRRNARTARARMANCPVHHG